MGVKVLSEQEVVEEAAELLLERLSPAKVVRFLAAWQIGRGNYAAIRERLFADETVQTLYDKVRAYQGSKE
jgi:hypothetical protein